MFLKNRNISYKIKRSKVTDYAALRVKVLYGAFLSISESSCCLNCRYHLLGRYHSKYKVNCSSPLVAQYEIEQEVQKREERKRFGAEILEVVGKLTDLILAVHITMFADYLSLHKQRLERSNQGSVLFL